MADGEENVLDVRTQKAPLIPKEKATKTFDENFLTSIYNGLPIDQFVENVRNSNASVEDQDKLGDEWLIHDHNIRLEVNEPIAR